MKINSIEKTFVYIDPEGAYNDQASEGNGQSPSSPLFSFPSELSDNAIYLVNKTYANHPAIIGPITDSALKSLTIWGMPNSDDPLYDMLPAEAKEAWGGVNLEENNRAVVYFKRNNDNYSETHSVKFTALKNLELRGITFLDSLNYNGNNNSGYALIVDNTSVAANILLDDVLFTSGVVTMNDNKVINVASYEDASGNTFGYRGGRWICANVASASNIPHSCIVRNCTFDYASYGTDGVRLGYAYNHFITNCNINIRGRQNSGATCISIKGSTNNYRKRCIAKVTNCTITLDFRKQNESVSGSYSDSVANNFGRAICIEDMETYMSGITAAFADSPSHEIASDASIGFNTSLLYARVYTGSRIENITADFGSWADLAQVCVVEICVDSDGNSSNDNPTSFNKGGQYTIVKNITISTAATASVGSTHQHASANENIGDEYSSGGGIMTNGAHIGQAYALNVYKDKVSSRLRSSDDILLQNIMLTCYRGSALFVRGCMLDMNSNNIQGLVNLEGCVGKIGSISTHAKQKAVRDGGCNLMYIGTITCNAAENRGEPAVDIVNFTSNILVNTVNITCYSGDSNPNGNECIYICTNNKVSGNYTCRNGLSFCTTWSIYRTGSSSQCSLKLQNNTTTDLNAPLRIGGTPFKGITVNVSKGTKVAKLYVTTHGYNAPSDIKEHLFVRIKREDGSIITDVEGNWEVDESSEWNNIEQGTAFVLSIPITISNDNGEDLEFEYSFNWAFRDASVFVDPYPVIEDVA